jgi:hypothetical protein
VRAPAKRLPREIGVVGSNPTPSAVSAKYHHFRLSNSFNVKFEYLFRILV